MHVNGPQINRANVVFIFRMFQLMVLVRLFFTLSDEVKGQAKNGLKGQLSAVLTHTDTHTPGRSTQTCNGHTHRHMGQAEE